MNSPTQTRRASFRIGAGGAMALIVACSVSIDSEGITESQALIDRLPSGATAIAWIDVEALVEAMPAEQWEEYEDMLQGDEDAPELEQFQEATGIDLRTDLRQMGVALMPGGDDDDAPIVLIEVDFDRGRFESLLTDVETIEYEGATMYAADDFARNLAVAVGSEEAIESLEAENSPSEGGQSTMVKRYSRFTGARASLSVVSRERRPISSTSAAARSRLAGIRSGPLSVFVMGASTSTPRSRAS